MEENKELMRCFVAIEMPVAVIKEVARVQETLGNWKFTGKMTELENLHLTLKFLGEIDKEKMKKVKEELQRIEFKEFEAKLIGIGTFSNFGNPRIAWIKIGGKEVFELQKKIDEAMEKIGFKKEERFMSHMTIARIKYVKDKKGFLEHVSKIGIRGIEWDVDKFCLKKSVLEQRGPTYSDLEVYEL